MRVFVLLLAICSRLVYGQTETRPSFEVASIKPNNSTSPGRGWVSPATGLSRRMNRSHIDCDGIWCVRSSSHNRCSATNLRGPSCLNHRFDIEGAKAAGDVVRGAEGTRRKQLMLQTLSRSDSSWRCITRRRRCRCCPVLARRDADARSKAAQVRRRLCGTFAARRSSSQPVVVPAVLDPCSSGISIAGVLGAGH
jgi:hypothetical protein